MDEAYGVVTAAALLTAYFVGQEVAERKALKEMNELKQRIKKLLMANPPGLRAWRERHENRTAYGPTGPPLPAIRWCDKCGCNHE